MTFIQRAAVVAGLALSVFAWHGSVQAQQTMRIAIVTPKDSHYGQAIDHFAQVVADRTEGRYKIETFYSSSLGGEREIVEAVQMGTQELSLTGTSVTSNFVPTVRVLDLPYLFRDYGHARGVLDSDIGEDLLESYKDYGFQALGWAENGFRHMTTSSKAIETPDDLKGLKLRTMETPIHIRAYREFGVLPTPMSFSELFTALQQGVVDGQENPLSVITTSKLYEVQEHLALTGHVYTAGVFLMNKDIFDSLSDEDKEIFTEAAREATVVARNRVDADEVGSVEVLRNAGMQIVEDIDKAAFRAKLDALYADMEKEFGADVFARISSFGQ